MDHDNQLLGAENEQSKTDETQESFRQNFSFAEKILPFEGMLPPVSDDHDIRKLTRQKVEEMLYAKELLEQECPQPKERVGPLSITQWIWENRVQREIAPELLRSCMRKLTCNPVNYLRKFKELVKLQQLAAKVHQLEPSELREEHLINPSTICYMVEQLGVTTMNKFLFISLIRRSKQLGLLESPFPLAWPERKETILHPRILNFQAHIQQKGFSKKHIRNCLAHVHQLFSWLCKSVRLFAGCCPDQISIIQIQNEHLLAYRSHQLKRVKNGACSPITFSHSVFAIRSFFYFLQERYGFTPPLQRFRAMNAPRYQPREMPNDQQIEAFFQVVDLYSVNPTRDQIGYRLLLYLGLRLSEAAKVTWGDINLGTRTLRIHSKGKRSHVLPLAGKLYRYILQAWNQQNASEYVLGNHPNSTEDQLYEHYKLYAMIAGWSFPGGVHFFRHVFITRLAQKGVLPQALKELARVVNVDTVSLYVQLTHQNQYLIKQINMLDYTVKER